MEAPSEALSQRESSLRELPYGNLSKRELSESFPVRETSRKERTRGLLGRFVSRRETKLKQLPLGKLLMKVCFT
jgi:hypothetical protein